MDSAMERAYIYLYWGKRIEELDSLISKANLHIISLKKASEYFSIWAPLGKSRKDALSKKQVDEGDLEYISSLLISGQNKTDTRPRMPIAELGYHIRLWNKGYGGIDAFTAIKCGVHSEFLSQDSQNLVSLEVNQDKYNNITEYHLSLIADDLVSIWNPTSGKIWYKKDEKEVIIHSF